MSWSLLLAFLLMHGLLLFNAVFHDPWIGYDGEAHVQYIDALARGRLPAAQDTPEWYSPPLPYLLPAMWRAAGFSLWSAAKLAQLLNVVFSMVLVGYLLKTCERLRPGAPDLKLLAIGFLGSLPVYYRTFATVRGEPLLAAAAVFSAHEAIALFVDGDDRLRRAARLGLGLGVMLLGRQWGFFMIPAFGLLALAALMSMPERRRALMRSLAVAMVACALASGWYYAHLAANYGSMKAFGRSGARTFSLSNQKPEFYLGLGADALFTHPVRPSFANQLLPTFYSDTWGDYWCYFVVYSKDTRTGKYLSGFWMDRALETSAAPAWLETNRDRVAGYLGRVNLVSLLPTAFLLGGLLAGLAALAGCWRLLSPGRPDRETLIRAFLFVLVAGTLAGYFWFLVMYPSPEKGRTIKPSYILQIFPFLCLLAAEMLVKIGERTRAAYRVLAALLVLCAAHNLPAMITRYIVW